MPDTSEASPAVPPAVPDARASGAEWHADRALPRALARILALEDFEEPARRYLPRPMFGYVAGGAETNASLRANRAAFDQVELLPRVLVDVSGRTAKTTLFGRGYGAPFGIAPMGGTSMAAYRGDIVLARAAAEANIPMIMSGASLARLEDVRSAGSTAWFQAYLPGETGPITQLLERVARAGFDTLVLTADVPVSANRENNVRSGFSRPLRPTLRLARESGVDGVIVSNHGGRQLDGAAAPLRALPAVAAQAGGMTVMMDGGIRRGTDILKALALGAQFVFVGRPFLYAAAIAGEAGVRHGIGLLSEEIERDMALLGITALAQMTRERIRPRCTSAA